MNPSSPYSAPKPKPASERISPPYGNGGRLRLVLLEHLAQVEAHAGRAALAIELEDAAALDEAVRKVVHEGRLAELAHLKLVSYETLFTPPERRR
jgi:hypothetical protein